MASYYGVMFPEFWTGRTGRELRRRGGKDAQILAMYLASNRHANMLGLYPLAGDDVQHETGLKPKELVRAFQVADECDYARYDATTEFVWVVSMARFRLGLKLGETLTAGDKRVVGVNKLYHGIAGNPFLEAFYDYYRDVLQLSKPRAAYGTATPMGHHSPLEGAPKGLRSVGAHGAPPHLADDEGLGSPSEGASKPPASQITGSGSETGIREQESDHQEQEKAGRCAPNPAPWLDSTDVNVNVVTRLAHEAFDELGDAANYADLADLLKTKGRQHKVAMTPDTVTAAIDSARHQRAQRRRRA